MRLFLVHFVALLMGNSEPGAHFGRGTQAHQRESHIALKDVYLTSSICHDPRSS